MAEMLLFHHAHGQTPGFLSFAGELRAAGHTVHAPDLYDGKTFETLDEGIGYAKEVGFEEILERGERAADELPDDLVYAGMSLGVMPAQKLAQTRPRAKGAVFLHGAFPPDEFGGEWPQAVPAQIHFMEKDEFGLEGDIDAARELENSAENAELFLYPGNGHVFTDSSVPDYDEEATTLVKRRVVSFLERVA